MIKNIQETKLDGVKVIELDFFNDFRGSYQETYNQKEYIDSGLDVNFVQMIFLSQSIKY